MPIVCFDYIPMYCRPSENHTDRIKIKNIFLCRSRCQPFSILIQILNGKNVAPYRITMVSVCLCVCIVIFEPFKPSEYTHTTHTQSSLSVLYDKYKSWTQQKKSHLRPLINRISFPNKKKRNEEKGELVWKFSISKKPPFQPVGVTLSLHEEKVVGECVVCC